MTPPEQDLQSVQVHSEVMYRKKWVSYIAWFEGVWQQHETGTLELYTDHCTVLTVITMLSPLSAFCSCDLPNTKTALHKIYISTSVSLQHSPVPIQQSP